MNSEPKQAPLTVLRPAQQVKIVSDISFDTYTYQPIDGFGQKVLRGLGWKDGDALGRDPNSKTALTKPIAFVPRVPRAGLGSGPSKLLPGSAAYQAQLQAQGKASQSTTWKYIDDGSENKSQEKMEIGKEVYIHSGRHAGLYGRVNSFQVLGDNGSITESNTFQERMIVELLLNDQLVAIGCSQAILTTEKKRLDQKAGKKNPKEDTKQEEERGEKRLKKLKWVRPGIRVRVISKKSRAKAHYNKKLTITDVHDRYSFSALTQEGIRVDTLREKDIETVMPKTGERTMVLIGTQSGEIGLLIERNAKKDICLLQMEDASVIKVSQNDCAAYVLD